MRPQRRGRRIALSDEELNEFLSTQHTCRVGTVRADGAPHVSPLWFVWDGHALWLNSVVKSQRWTDLMRDPRVSVMVDDGTAYFELVGVEIIGRVEPVGPIPRTPGPCAEVEVPEQLFGNKYAGGTFVADGTHAWLRLVPDKIVSWDFRKIKGA